MITQICYKLNAFFLLTIKFTITNYTIFVAIEVIIQQAHITHMHLFIDAYAYHITHMHHIDL